MDINKYAPSGGKAIVDCEVKRYPIQAAYDKNRLLEPMITRDLLSITQKLGSKLEALDYSIKTASSVEDKIDREYKSGNLGSPETIFLSLTDSIRYTQICKKEDMVNFANMTIKTLEERGYKLTKIKNYFARPFPNTGYKGLHFNFLSPQGKIFELQLHTPESLMIKDEGHRRYEQARSISTPPETAKILYNEMVEIHSLAPTPDGIESIHDMAIKGRELEELIQQIEQPNIEIKKVETDAGKMVFYTILQHGLELERGCEIHHYDNSVSVTRSFVNNQEQTTNVYNYDRNGNSIILQNEENLDVNHTIDIDSILNNKEVKIISDLNVEDPEL